MSAKQIHIKEKKINQLLPSDKLHGFWFMSELQEIIVQPDTTSVTAVILISMSVHSQARDIRSGPM